MSIKMIHPIYFIFSNSTGADVGLSLVACAKDCLFGDHHCHRNRCHPSRRWCERICKTQFCSVLVWCNFFFLYEFVYYTRRLFSCRQDCRLYNIICIKSISYILAHRKSISANDTRAPYTEWFIFHWWTRVQYVLYVYVVYWGFSNFLRVHMFDWHLMRNMG